MNLQWKYPGLSISEGEITRKYIGKSRKGVITYWSYRQEVLVNGIKHVVTGADESWLEFYRNELYKEQYDISRGKYKPVSSSSSDSTPSLIGPIIMTMLIIAMIVDVLT